MQFNTRDVIIAVISAVLSSGLSLSSTVQKFLIAGIASITGGFPSE